MFRNVNNKKGSDKIGASLVCFSIKLSHRFGFGFSSDFFHLFFMHIQI